MTNCVFAENYFFKIKNKIRLTKIDFFKLFKKKKL